MIQPICKDPLFLARKSLPAGPEDLPTAPPPTYAHVSVEPAYDMQLDPDDDFEVEEDDDFE